MFRACISEFGFQGCVCTLVSGSGEDWEWCGPSLGQKGVTEDDMVGWHHWQCTVSFSKLQGSLVCCSSWGCRVGHDLATEQQFSWSCPRDPLINLGLALIYVSLETWLLSHIEKNRDSCQNLLTLYFWIGPNKRLFFPLCWPLVFSLGQSFVLDLHLPPVRFGSKAYSPDPLLTLSWRRGWMDFLPLHCMYSSPHLRWSHLLFLGNLHLNFLVHSIFYIRPLGQTSVFFSGRCWYCRHAISNTKNKLSVALCFYFAFCLVSYRIEVNLIFYLSEGKYKLQLGGQHESVLECIYVDSITG